MVVPISSGGAKQRNMREGNLRAICRSTARGGGGAFVGGAEDLERNLAAFTAKLAEGEREEFSACGAR
jgi:hypothetical protein